MNFKIKDYIKVTKLNEVENPLFPSADKASFVPGLPNNGSVSLPNEYWIRGILLSELSVGTIIEVDRYVRNGESVRGHFTSSCIQKIDEEKNLYYTHNSVYKIEMVELYDEICDIEAEHTCMVGHR